MAWKDFKDLSRLTVSEKVLLDKAIYIASKLQYGGYQRGLATMVYEYFNEKSKETTTHVGAGTISEDQKLAYKLRKPINKKFQMRKV